MLKFKIKKDIPGLDKAGVMDGKTLITSDAAWIKELRKLPKATVEEIVPEEEKPEAK